MRVWSLTQLGKRVARGTRNPDTTAYKVIHCLDRLGTATSDQIASYCGVAMGEVNTALSRMSMMKPPLVGVVE